MPQVSLEDLTTDQLLARARQLETVAATVGAIANDPETRESWLRLLKKKNPGLSLPEIDAKDAVLGEVGKLTKTVEDMRNAMLERDVRDRIERERSAVRTKYHLTDDDITGVEKLMIDKENPISSYDAAARVHLASRQSATPSSVNFQPPTYQMPEKDVWGAGIGNPARLNKIAIDEGFKAWNEIRSGQVAGMGGVGSAFH
jgi:hypothetical protein